MSKLLLRVLFPSSITFSRQEILSVVLENGAANVESAEANDTPTLA
jgi:hypothetical protein